MGCGCRKRKIRGRHRVDSADAASTPDFLRDIEGRRVRRENVFQEPRIPSCGYQPNPFFIKKTQKMKEDLIVILDGQEIGSVARW